MVIRADTSELVRQTGNSDELILHLKLVGQASRLETRDFYVTVLSQNSFLASSSFWCLLAVLGISWFI